MFGGFLVWFVYIYLHINIKVWSCLFGHFDPSPSNVHNLAMALSWAKFDGKIMIYIEFCIRKSILKFLGVSYFLGEGPPKSLLLAGPTPNA